MKTRSTRLLLVVLLPSLLMSCPAGAEKAFTDRDLQKYERRPVYDGEGSGRADDPEALWPAIEAWLDLNETENLIERTKSERDRRIDELIRTMEAEKADCTGVVGAEYRDSGGVYGILVNATARKNCELGVERKYDTLIRDTAKAAGERLEELLSRKRELEAKQRILERGFR